MYGQLFAVGGRQARRPYIMGPILQASLPGVQIFSCVASCFLPRNGIITWIILPMWGCLSEISYGQNMSVPATRVRNGITQPSNFIFYSVIYNLQPFCKL